MPAGWSELEVEGAARSVPLLRLELEPRDGRPVGRVVRRDPAVAERDGGGATTLSLTLVLDGQPEPGTADLTPFVRQGAFAAEFTVGVDDVLLDSLPEDAGDTRVIFPETLTYRLLDTESRDTLAERTVTLGQTRAALDASLGAERALRLLDAARGRPSGLEIEAILTYRRPAADPGRTLRMRFDLAAVHAFLEPRVGGDRVLYSADLGNYLARLIEIGTVAIEGEGSEPGTSTTQALAAQSVDDFIRAASMILESLEPDGRLETLGRRYRLGSAPHSSFETRFSTTVTESAAPLESLELRTALEDVLPDAVDGRPTETWLHAVGTGGGGDLSPLRRRTVQRNGARAARDTDGVKLVRLGNRLTSLSAALRPGGPSAHPVLAAHAIALDRFDHVVFVGDQPSPPANLPVVRDPDASHWPDRTDEGKSWYAPELRVEADATAGIDASPFSFSFEAGGHDVEGRSGLDAEIRFTLKPDVPPAVAELTGNDDRTFVAVPMENLSVTLDIPFRDGEGATRIEHCRASTQPLPDGRVQVDVRLLDDWVRLAYGALAYDGFQPEPSTLSVAYDFPAYLPIEARREVVVAHGGKKLGIPLVASAREARAASTTTSLDAKRGTLRFPGGEVRFADAPRLQRSRPRPPLAVAHHVPAALPVATLAIRPEVLAANVASSDDVRDLMVGRQTRRVSLPVLFPCGPHGSHYVERRDGTTHAIGCQEHLRLGESDPRLLEPVDLPAGFDLCQVYRSLQTPGLFVIVPRRYAITRYEPGDDERAYRPTLLLYSTIDIEDLGASRCVYSCTLQPDLPEFVRVRLLEHLRRAEHPSPSLQYFTELPGALDVEWSLPVEGRHTSVDTVRTWDGFEVNLSTDALGVPQLNAVLANSGIAGTATLTLGDGTSLWTGLRLHLRSIVGPFAGGPLEAARENGTLTLRNRIESPVAVSDLLVLDETGAVERTVSVRDRIAPGGTLETDIGGATRAVPVYSVDASAVSLEEIRSFIEDISIDLVLLNRIDLAAAGLEKLDVEARLQGRSDSHEVEFTPETDLAQRIEFLLPLTEYIADPAIELRFQGLRDGGPIEVEPIEWHVVRDGVMVHVTSELLNLPEPT